MRDIIVIANSHKVFPSNSTSPTLAPSLAAQQELIFVKGLGTVKTEADVTDPEIVVTARKLREEAESIGVYLRAERCFYAKQRQGRTFVNAQAE